MVLFKTKLKYENNICVATPSNLQRQAQIKKKNARNKTQSGQKSPCANTYGLGESIAIPLRNISEAFCPL